MILDNLKNISKENLLQKIIKDADKIIKIVKYFKPNLLEKIKIYWL